MYTAIKQKAYNIISNIQTWLNNLFIHRDNSVVLIGAWMGLKFADNSRYLFQYLSENKDVLGLKHVIWVTRNQQVNDELNKMGYESYMIGTKESRYWHLKAGTHILCNAAFPQEKYDPDIDTKYSWGAVKIQLWHGVGMKSVGAASNYAKNFNKDENSIKTRYHNSKLASLFTLGGWNEEFFLSTSQRNKEVNLAISKCRKDHLFISIYPRNCKCLKYTEHELKIIKELNDFSGKILYLPTFRSDYKHYEHPLSNDKFVQYLNDNGFLWIEKPHTVSDFQPDAAGNKNVMMLESDFDINVLFEYIDIVISDYSSVVFDGVYKNIPTVMYAPDLEDFKHGNVGFLFNIEKYCKDLLARTLDEVMDQIDEIRDGVYFNSQREKIFQTIQRDFFDNRESEYKLVWDDIKKLQK